MQFEVSEFKKIDEHTHNLIVSVKYICLLLYYERWTTSDLKEAAAQKFATCAAKAGGRWIERQGPLSRVRELSSANVTASWYILCGHEYEEGQCSLCSCSVGFLLPSRPMEPRADRPAWLTARVNYNAGRHVRWLRDVSHARGGLDPRDRGVPQIRRKMRGSGHRETRAYYTVSLSHFRYEAQFGTPPFFLLLAFLFIFFYLNVRFIFQQTRPSRASRCDFI